MIFADVASEKQNNIHTHMYVCIFVWGTSRMSHHSTCAKLVELFLIHACIHMYIHTGKVKYTNKHEAKLYQGQLKIILNMGAVNFKIM